MKHLNYAERILFPPQAAVQSGWRTTRNELHGLRVPGGVLSAASPRASLGVGVSAVVPQPEASSLLSLCVYRSSCPLAGPDGWLPVSIELRADSVLGFFAESVVITALGARAYYDTYSPCKGKKSNSPGCVCSCAVPTEARTGRQIPGAGVGGGCKLPGIDAGN